MIQQMSEPQSIIEYSSSRAKELFEYLWFLRGQINPDAVPLIKIHYEERLVIVHCFIVIPTITGIWY